MLEVSKDASTTFSTRVPNKPSFRARYWRHTWLSLALFLPSSPWKHFFCLWPKELVVNTDSFTHWKSVVLYDEGPTRVNSSSRGALQSASYWDYFPLGTNCSTECKRMQHKCLFSPLHSSFRNKWVVNESGPRFSWGFSSKLVHHKCSSLSRVWFFWWGTLFNASGRLLFKQRVCVCRMCQRPQCK